MTEFITLDAKSGVDALTYVKGVIKIYAYLEFLPIDRITSTIQAGYTTDINGAIIGIAGIMVDGGAFLQKN